ncbi:hypothetical protein K439DRAFT_532538 [Ramaria rubella]|nr:hypothetical protein K439DRAFT_532538 [Ramaria rubella]
MSLCFRRLYATLPNPPSPSFLSARASSSPLQVRRRRLKKELASPEVPSSPSSLTASEKERYSRLKRLGALLREDKDGFREPSEEEWLTELNARRTRIRGTRKRQVEDPDTGESVEIEDVVGQRIYLPNIVFRMMRNYTPPGQPYNPWEATFRIPHSLTKLDIRSYLYAVYGVKCTYIRTDNYFKRLWSRKRKVTEDTSTGYKRAVVGLVEPFYYPEAIEDMSLQERQTREKWLDEHFQLKFLEKTKTAHYRRVWDQRKDTFKPFNLVGPRGTILKAVLERRRAREQATNEGAQTLLQRSSSTAGVAPLDMT